MTYKILKNAGFVPPEVTLRNHIAKAEELLAGTEDIEARYRQIKKLNLLIMKLNTARGTRISLEMDQHYEKRILERLGHDT